MVRKQFRFSFCYPQEGCVLLLTDVGNDLQDYRRLNSEYHNPYFDSYRNRHSSTYRNVVVSPYF
jgi:hypothetical protein